MVLETLQLPEEFVAPQESRFLGRKVKDSDDVLWSVVVLGGFLPPLWRNKKGRMLCEYRATLLGVWSSVQ